MIVLTLLRKLRFPVIAECITPSVLEGKTVHELAALEVWEGNKQKKLSDIFQIEQTPEETPTITINGDASEVRRVGLGMKQGEIIVNGNIGMHLGEKMAGGKIIVNGNAGQWAGAEMKGGVIEIHGNASDYLASPYRGSDRGMSGGKITVDGDVGSDSACYMKGGVIKIRGDSGPFLGFRMKDGAIHVEKNCASRVGANMSGGKIIVSGSLEEPMPTFTIDSVKPKVKLDDTETVPGPFYMFLGDLAENSSSGKLFVSKTNNPYLKEYERFL
jgi:formylmethanofuran dehydrogenase subunit C